MADSFRWYVPLSKVERQPDGTVFVEGPVSSEKTDSEGEVVDYEALKEAASDYMRFANVREMHDDTTAAGVTTELLFDDEQRSIWARVHVVDPGAVQKVLTGVYKGFSIGGKKLARQIIDGVTHLTKVWWAELSLVDRPANPDAVFSLAKRDYTDQAAEGVHKVAEGTFPPADADTNTGDDTQGDQTKAADETAADAAKPSRTKAPGSPKTRKAIKVAMAKISQLAKGGNKTLKHLGDAVESVVCAIAEEATDGDEEGVAALQSILTAITKQMSLEAAEGDAGDEPDEEDMLMPEPMDETMAAEYAAKIGDMRKAATDKQIKKAVRKARKANLEKLAKRYAAKQDKGKPAPAAPAPTPDAPVDPLAKASADIDALMSKMAIDDRVTPADLVKVKGEVLEALNSAKEDIAKAIAAQPVPGGPIAADGLLARMGVKPDDNDTDYVRKAIDRVTDPIAKEALGKVAAADQIRQIQAGR